MLACDVRLHRRDLRGMCIGRDGFGQQRLEWRIGEGCGEQPVRVRPAIAPFVSTERPACRAHDLRALRSKTSCYLGYASVEADQQADAAEFRVHDGIALRADLEPVLIMRGKELLLIVTDQFAVRVEQ
ncbi:hypothetical protein NECAME_17515 [Necator americanus]|uniref:Uncharacterized protein n=1 Tax=Necator americanus TaxID=51031 RepID=W2TNQ6_NECAM|nr:hypothetical protein NECAME_17515 [Necator americanus]ETN83294.1 hypothetical protein NECAME_17515 [Necator americanus]